MTLVALCRGMPSRNCSHCFIDGDVLLYLRDAILGWTGRRELFNILQQWKHVVLENAIPIEVVLS